jgi:hypothetical protein
MSELSWEDLAKIYPEFVQWVVQRFGPLPDGPVLEEDYDRFKDAYETR